MYIGPQGIVHGTTITVLNAFRKINKDPKGGLFVTSGLGGMSERSQKQEILQVVLPFVRSKSERLPKSVTIRNG
jgi:urocanate hydratase